jgi:hypothetical protein
MKFENVPIPVGVENVDPSAMMLAGGVVVAAALVALSAPRLFSIAAIVACGVVGGLLIG